MLEGQGRIDINIWEVVANVFVEVVTLVVVVVVVVVVVIVAAVEEVETPTVIEGSSS